MNLNIPNIANEKLIFLFLAISLTLFFLVVFLFFLREKNKSAHKKRINNNSPFFDIPSERKKMLEDFINQEIKKSLLGFEKKLNQSTFNLEKKYQELFETSRLKMEKTLSQIGEFKINIQDTLLKIAREELLKLQEAININIVKFQERYFQTYNALLEEIKEKTSNLAEQTTQRMIIFYQLMGENVQKEMDKVEEEIEKYKKKRLEEAEKKIYQLLGEIAKRTLGKTLDLTTHEELIIEALERAKKEGIIV